MKIFWLFNHPAPYKIDFFNELGKSCDLHVVFERKQEGGRNAEFYSHMAKNFRATFLKSITHGIYNNYAFGIIKQLKKEKYDLYVINGWSTLTEMKAIRYLRRHHIPYIFAINGGIIKPDEPKWKANLKHKYIPGAFSYLAPSKNSIDYLAYYGADPALAKLFPYSTIYEKEVLKAPLSLEEKKAIREELHLEGEKVYVSAGQLIERKNYLTLLALWKAMPSSKHLYIAGEGEQKEELLNFIKENNLTNCHILPYQKHDAALRLFSCADAFVFPSKEDIYGHVVNEALSQGCPVISSHKVNAADALIQNGENGFLIDFASQEQFLKAMNDPRLDTFGANAIETARKNTLEKMAEFHAAYFSALKGE